MNTLQTEPSDPIKAFFRLSGAKTMSYDFALRCWWMYFADGTKQRVDVLLDVANQREHIKLRVRE